MFFFLDCKILGTSLLAGKIKVKGPGNAFFKIRNKLLSILFAYKLKSLKSAQIKLRFAFSGSIFFMAQIFSIASLFNIEHPNP